jgi:hypothetical protein
MNEICPVMFPLAKKPMLQPNTVVTHPTAYSSHACKLVLSLYLRMLFLPKGGGDDLPCSTRLVRGLP